MRNKIIAVNAIVVLLVGVLAFVIVWTQLGRATRAPELLKKTAMRDAVGAAAKLQLDAFRAERWLAAKAAEPALRSELTKSTTDARENAARKVSDQVLASAAGQLPVAASFVAVVDGNGKVLARSGAEQGRGEDIAARFSAFKDALAKASPGSDIWADKTPQYIASYAPMRDEQGRLLMLVLGVAINDALGRVAEATSGRGVVLVNDQGEAIVTTQGTGADVTEAVKATATEVKSSMATGTVTPAISGDVTIASAPLEGFGDGKRGAIVAAAPPSLLENAGSVPLSILGVTVLGLVLVVLGGWILGSYISRPIAMLEEGLLAILNGQTDKRFELDHAELGGLAFRIDQLLNQLMGVEEDNTDDEGRVSKAPTAANFGEALAVDKSGAVVSPPGGSEVDPKKLAAEPAEQYYARLYREYIAAKKALGEQVDHITDAAFRSRIQGMEQDAAQKHGRTVRYHVQSNGREVVLLAVPLG